MRPDNEPEVKTWMQELAKEPLEHSHRPLPDPDLLWMKAQLLDRQAAMERALRPVEWFETIARVLIGFAVCAVALICSKLLAMPAAEFLSPTMVTLIVSIGLAAIAMAAYPIWAGE